MPPVPDIGDGKKHNWGDVVHVDTVTWLAKWKDSINGEDKCVWLAANSSWKGKSDLAKYEKARKLKGCIDRIRKHYQAALKSSDDLQRQLGTAMWVIDILALRVGGEKDEDDKTKSLLASAEETAAAVEIAVASMPLPLGRVPTIGPGRSPRERELKSCCAERAARRGRLGLGLQPLSCCRGCGVAKLSGAARSR